MNPIQHLKKFVKSDVEGHAFIALSDSPFQTAIVKCILGNEFGEAFELAKANKNSFKFFEIKEQKYAVVVANEYDFTTYMDLPGLVNLETELGTRVIVFGEYAQGEVLGNLLIAVGASWYGFTAPWKHHNDALHYVTSRYAGCEMAQCKIA
ncbi:hypothetical protein 2050HW_00200 [Serratia phage vB_SmaM_ 2050HW]|uniref:Uncharacterized protein n=2 Tax=Moabitevirus TaxID=2843422 RepID=A0A7T3NC69_9CAUD|nr:hypothetical protein HWB23_gp200 [Serratia phage vB_SmaM_ 2050HW]QPX76884.1 hypothetical protein [Serratia phage vB_SmaM_Yaphecito]UCR74791.1 hypothetical protein [Serratia phage BUCT660]UQT03660.1 hypothetical protein KODAMA_01930 [Serratia phage vB_SmaM-Kodama]URG14053.1 hypothetical protein [Pectobacterium phage vB_ParM-25]ATA65535.1 hypothetical protein 2050HW_00200 [Serratia phage vB_SmaM_ 2050HW]